MARGPQNSTHLLWHESVAPADGVSSARRLARDGELSGAFSGKFPEHRAIGQAGAARIVEIEHAAHELAAREQSRYRRVVLVEHLRLGGNLEPAERERDAGGDRIGFE